MFKAVPPTDVSMFMSRVEEVDDVIPCQLYANGKWKLAQCVFCFLEAGRKEPFYRPGGSWGFDKKSIAKIEKTKA